MIGEGLFFSTGHISRLLPDSRVDTEGLKPDKDGELLPETQPPRVLQMLGDKDPQRSITFPETLTFLARCLFPSNNQRTIYARLSV